MTYGNKTPEYVSMWDVVPGTEERTLRHRLTGREIHFSDDVDDEVVEMPPPLMDLLDLSLIRAGDS